jgi:predicted esterase
MAEDRFTTVWNQLIPLYQQKAFAQALELVQREAACFPQQGLMYHWKMCLAAQVHDSALALQALREALEHGYCYATAMLREDGDLSSLQALPEYQQLALLAEQRFFEIEAQTRPALLVISPEGEAALPAPLLLALHGWNHNAQMAATEWRPMTARGWVLACAQSSQMSASGAFHWNDGARSAADVLNLYRALPGAQTIDPEHILLGGFSTGGGLAIQLAVTGAINTRGFIAVGPILPDAEVLTPHLETASARGLRGYMQLGLQMAPEFQEPMRQLHALLNAYGIPCQLEESPEVAHAFPADFAHSLDKALAFLYL